MMKTLMTLQTNNRVHGSSSEMTASVYKHGSQNTECMMNCTKDRLEDDGLTYLLQQL